MKRSLQNISYFLILLGIFIFIIQPLSPPTGAVINLSKISNQFNSLASLAIIILGMLLLKISLKNKTPKIVIQKTKGFKKQAKGKNQKEIKNAIDKIKKNITNKKFNKIYGDHKVNINKKGKINYHLTPDGSIILTSYKISSNF